MNYSYFKFENNFRGSREQIRDKLTFYDEILDSILTHHQYPNVLDIAKLTSLSKATFGT